MMHSEWNQKSDKTHTLSNQSLPTNTFKSGDQLIESDSSDRFGMTQSNDGQCDLSNT
jgi:hypothetical protein